MDDRHSLKVSNRMLWSFSKTKEASWNIHYSCPSTLELGRDTFQNNLSWFYPLAEHPDILQCDVLKNQHLRQLRLLLRCYDPIICSVFGVEFCEATRERKNEKTGHPIKVHLTAIFYLFFFFTFDFSNFFFVVEQ